MKFDENIKIKEHFRVPDAYFEQFNVQMIERLEQFQRDQETAEGQKKLRVPHSLFRILRKWSVAAAVVAVLVVSAFTYFYSSDDQARQSSQQKVKTVTETTPATAVVSPAAKQVLAEAVEKEVKVSSASEEKDKPVTQASEYAPIKGDRQTAISNRNTANGYSSYTTYDQNEVDRAAAYMCIDNQDVSEMLYETNF